MVRSTMALLGLAILLALAVLPEPGQAKETDPTSYTVVDGDSLWDLARRFYGDPGQWTRLYEANRGQLTNPSLLPPGVVLEIPGDEMAAALVDVVVVTPGGGAAYLASAAPPPKQERVGPKPLDRRTVFWPDTTQELGIGGNSETSGPPMAADAFYDAAWLAPENGATPRMGEITGFAGAQEIRATLPSARPSSRVRLQFGTSVPAVGARLRSFRVMRTIPGVGRVVAPTGILTVRSVDDQGALASVDHIFDRMVVGDLLEPLPSFPFRGRETLAAVAGGPEATIIGVALEHELQSPGDLVFLDVGSDQGVDIGDEFDVIWAGAGSDKIEGVLQVLAVQENRATARIRKLENPVFEVGVRVRLSRRVQ